MSKDKAAISDHLEFSLTFDQFRMQFILVESKSKEPIFSFKINRSLLLFWSVPF